MLELRSPLLYTAMLENGVRVPRDPGAWFRTRDVFRAEGGRWYMEARQGDLIIGANGENLSPDLIEQRLALQAGTASCVLGMELEGDERPVLIVQTAADDYARARASAAAYEAVARLPLTMRPARIFLTEQELPISFGKPRRAELREKLADGSIVLTPAHRPEPEELTRLEDESSRALVQELCELLGSVTGQTVGPDTQLLQELGVDSLTYYNIFPSFRALRHQPDDGCRAPAVHGAGFCRRSAGGAGGGRMKLLFRWINKLLCGWNVGLYFRPRIRYEGKSASRPLHAARQLSSRTIRTRWTFFWCCICSISVMSAALSARRFYECNRFLNWCLRMLGAIKVDRFSFGMDFFCESVEALRRGQLLLIFPGGALFHDRRNSGIPQYGGPACAADRCAHHPHVALRELWLR